VLFLFIVLGHHISSGERYFFKYQKVSLHMLIVKEWSLSQLIWNHLKVKKLKIFVFKNNLARKTKHLLESMLYNFEFIHIFVTKNYCAPQEWEAAIQLNKMSDTFNFALSVRFKLAKVLHEEFLAPSGIELVIQKYSTWTVDCLRKPP
jgi:hypothetical protein